jgi:hypothetical protein
LATFFYRKRYVFILAKNVLGYILGDFVHKLIWLPCRLVSFICGQLSGRQGFAQGDQMSL